MKRELSWLAAAVLATGLIAAGCGDDDDDGGDGGEALTKEEFLAQGNQICEEGNAASDAAAEQVFGQGRPTPAEEEAFVTDTLVPNVQGQIDDLRALEPPEGDEETINGILDSAEDTLGEIEADPSLITQSRGADPFAEVNKQLNDYGLTSCGSGD